MSEPLRPGAPITIGTPVTDCTALVLDHRLRPVPDHVPGELYISGPGVARGYLDRRGPTATRFVARPGGSGDVMYRTGDIVRRDADGALIYHGRSDNQVKVRGFRIELDEVTAALTAVDGVDFATTVVRGEGPTAVLVGYVTLTGATDAEEGLAVGEPTIITRARHRAELEAAAEALQRFRGERGGPEIKVEELRIAARYLGRLTGRIDVEEVLGAIFSEFCIGK